MKRLCIADFDDTLILTDSLKTIMLKERWFLSPTILTAGVRLFLCRLIKKGEYEARSDFKKRLLLKYGRMPETVREEYIRSFREQINPVAVRRIREGRFDRTIILSASEEMLIGCVIGDMIGQFEVIANKIPPDSTSVAAASRIPSQCRSFRTCYGAEKLRRLTEVIPDYSEYHISVFTDSWSDRSLIDIADEAFLVNRETITQVKPA